MDDIVRILGYPAKRTIYMNKPMGQKNGAKTIKQQNYSRMYRKSFIGNENVCNLPLF